jgi:ssDNA-binding Zn-finger/Zn-ribbon topoisomerase 1
MIYKKIPCPKCGEPLRHRVISNLRYCANVNCPDYKGIPPIKLNRTFRNDSLINAFSDEAWAEVEKDINNER